jgi:hypothetical protein
MFWECDFHLDGEQMVPPNDATFHGYAELGYIAVCGGFTISVRHDVPEPVSVELRAGGAGENGELLGLAVRTEYDDVVWWEFDYLYASGCPTTWRPYHVVVTTPEHPDGVIRGDVCELLACHSDSHCHTDGESSGEGEGEGEGAPPAGPHAADQNGDARIQLSELLRVIQFYNVGGLHCADGVDDTEDGYRPGLGVPQACAPHSADYQPEDWQVSISELLRLIQIYNSDGYTPCESGEDGYCIGVAKTGTV